MKDKIEQILRDNLVVSGSGLSILGTKGATNKLMEFMCYQEVRAIFEWVGYKCWEPEFESEVVRQLKPHYPKELILKSIEQVKNEQK